MKSKTVVIACVATLALLAVAFLGSGSLLGSSLGMAGQKAIDGVIGFIAYPNRSESESPADSGADRSARLAAAKARAAGSAGGAATESNGGFAVTAINAATEAANAANGGSVAIAARAGQLPGELAAEAEMTAEHDANAEADEISSGAAAGEETMEAEPASENAEASSEMQVAMASSDGNVTLEHDDSPAAGEAFAPPAATPDAPGDDAAWSDDASSAQDAARETDAYESDGEDAWEDSDPFEFEDESVLREMGPGYSAFDGRDPFLALITTTDQSSATGAMIDPDGLRFVGIIWGSNGICALVEDRERRGYVVREGDRVLYGRVSSISRDAIVIDQVIHGEFKRLTLRLEPTRMEGN